MCVVRAYMDVTRAGCRRDAAPSPIEHMFGSDTEREMRTSNGGRDAASELAELVRMDRLLVRGAAAVEQARADVLSRIAFLLSENPGQTLSEFSCPRIERTTTLGHDRGGEVQERDPDGVRVADEVGDDR